MSADKPHKPRCAICGRATLNPALLIAGRPIGRVCALKIKDKLSEKSKNKVFRDSATMDLFENGK